MPTVSLPESPPRTVVGFGLQFGSLTDEVRYCLMPETISLTCDREGKFVINFSLPLCWLPVLQNELEAAGLAYAGYSRHESLKSWEARELSNDPGYSDLGVDYRDQKVYYYTLDGTYPRRIHSLQKTRSDIVFIAAGQSYTPGA